VGVSALRYPSGQTDPLDIGGQVLTSSVTGIVVAEIHAESDQSPGAGDDSSTTSRQPSATAAAARLPPEGPSLRERIHLNLVIVCTNTLVTNSVTLCISSTLGAVV